MWQNPEYRDKMSIIHKKIWSHPEYRKKVLDYTQSDKARNLQRKRWLSEQNPMRGKKGTTCPNWKGGIVTHDRGYLYEYHPLHPYALSAGYVAQHRLVMEYHLGRLLEPKEVVHHKNGDVTDNRIENLELLKNQSEHMAVAHSKRDKKSGRFICPKK